MQQKTLDISKTYTLDEYIKMDETGPERHEFYNGKLIPMPGESILHNDICLHLYTLLKQALKNKRYRINVESVKVNIEGEKKYVYPDIAIFHEQPERDLPYKDYIIYQPILIAEILSDSTRKYDSTDKFILYQKISSLRYYLLVEPEKHLVIFYEKDNTSNWLSKPFTELNEVISLPLFDAQFSLADIYQQ